MPRDLGRLNATYADDAEGALRFALSGALGRFAMAVNLLQIKEHTHRPHIRFGKLEFRRFGLEGEVRLQPNRSQVTEG